MRTLPYRLGLGIVLVGVIATAASAQGEKDSVMLPEEMVGVTWEWVSFTTPKEQIDVAEPERYTVKFSPEGAMAIRVDCNRGFSQLAAAADSRITIEPIALTMMACEDDQLGDRFTRELERVGSFFILDGDLLLELPMDSGTFRFRPAEQ